MMSLMEKMNRSLELMSSKGTRERTEGMNVHLFSVIAHSTSEVPKLTVTPACNDQDMVVYTQSRYQRADDCLGLFVGEFNACGPML